VPVVNGHGVTIAALTTFIPVCRMTPELQAKIVEDLQAHGRQLSELVAWLPSFGSRRS
jgi:DNA-binding IclR family transcriptional regulator